MGKKRISLAFIPFVLMYFTSILLVGVADLFTAGFSLERIGKAQFWYNIFLSMFANIFALMATLLWQIKKQREEDKRVLEKQNKINDCADNDLEPDFEDEYLKDINLNSKITAFKENIKEQIDMLNKKAKPEDFFAWNSRVEEGTKKNKYVQKRLVLEEQLKSEYIKENIDFIKVEYEYITKAKVINGYQPKSKRQRYINGKKTMFADLLPNTLLAISFMVFISSFAFEFINADKTLIITLSAKIFSLVWNAYNGYSYAFTYIEKVLITNLNASLDLIVGYLAWRKESKGNMNKENDINGTNI